MSFRWEYGSITFSAYDEDGFLGVQCDVYGELESGMPPFESLGTYGFANRPPDPSKDGSCTVLYFYQGDQAFAIPFGDPRRTRSLPPLKKGSSVQYCDKPSFDLHDGEDGTKTVYVEVGNSAHLMTIGVDGNGDAIYELVHSEGMAVTMLKNKLILKNAAGDAFIELGPDGVVINGNLKVIGSVAANGASIDPTGDVVSSLGVSLNQHPHPTAMGPSGPPTPTQAP